MSNYGITEEGFKRKKQDQILTEINDSQKVIFGENLNVSPESPDGQVNGVSSESYANLWELAQLCYDAFNPSAATGVSLSNLVQINGLTRLPATSSRAYVDMVGVAATLIPSGSLVATSDTGVLFATEEDLTLDGGGLGSVFVSAQDTGPIIALANTLTVISTPIAGWDTVTNVLDATEGTHVESDAALRARRNNSVARDAQAIIDAIFAEVAAVDGVTQTTVLENDTDIADGNGLPPHSFHVIVVGGADADIGQAIWLKKPAGITSFGSTTIPILDSQGLPHDIDFSRPTEIPIFVEVTLVVDTNYPADGDTQMKQAIVDYANGELVAGRGFGLGDDVIYVELYTPVNSIIGSIATDLRIGVSVSPTGVVDIPITVTETSVFTIADIVVNS